MAKGTQPRPWAALAGALVDRRLRAVRIWAVVVAGISAIIGLASAQTAPPRPLSANDISILFPMPRTEADLAGLLALSDLAGPTDSSTRGRLWSDADFGRFLGIAESPAGQVAGTTNRIGLPAEVKQIDAWFVAGIRVDSGAPGLTKEIIEQYGQQPQIRFVVQPVTKTSTGIKVHDIAVHLIFSYSAAEDLKAAADGCLPRQKPDLEAFQAVVRDVIALRDQLAKGQLGGTSVDTAGRPLAVHPGLTGATAGPFRAALKAMIEKHLSPERLTAGAIMGLQTPQPWIFVALLKVPLPSGKAFIPVPAPTLDGQQIAQMLNMRGGNPIVPTPATNNLNPITCRHATLQTPPLPAADRKGVSTAEFMNANISNDRVREIVDIIADPARSHFFNTDCLSCHTDTRQSMQRLNLASFEGISPDVLPKSSWNVRNFGWFPGGANGGPTVTRRTATETEDVLRHINKELLK